MVLNGRFPLAKCAICHGAQKELLQMPWPLGETKPALGSLEIYLDTIRRAFNIWDQSIPSIQFTEAVLEMKLI